MICNFMIFSESVGSGACLSARNYWINRTKTYKLLICRFFIVYKSCFQDNKRTVKDIVSLLNRYLFPSEQKR